jgi:hypothetical protein
LRRKPPDRTKVSSFGSSKRAPPSPRELAQRQALNALKRAKRIADRAGVDLSEWEGEFLGSVSERVKTYGRAFADPDKGAAGAPQSLRQGVKLKEIVAKAKGKPRKGFTRRKGLGKPSVSD